MAATLCVLAACSGNSSMPGPRGGSPTPNGQGVNPKFDQLVTFVVRIPPAPARKTVAHRLGAVTPSPQPSALYVSPGTGSISVVLAAVNGVSLAQPAPAVPAGNVPAGCAPAGCTVTIANVPAATGIDTFTVETFTGANGTGSVISSGVVNVGAPTTGSQQIGPPNSTTLTVGGFVASLALSVAPTAFTQGTPTTAHAVLVPKDATGATIIGNALFGNPIVISVSSATHFTFSGASSISLTMPQSSPLPLQYDGGSSGVVTVTASTVDGNGAAVNASTVLTVSLPTPPPSPSPSPTPSHGPRPPSLYVLDAANNAAEEFPSPAPNATPRRSFGLTLAQLGCDPGAVPFAAAMVQGIVVDNSGNTYVTNNPFCNTSIPQGNPYVVYQFTAAAKSTAPPASVFTAPAAYSPTTQQSIGLDPATQLVLVPVAETATNTAAVLRVAFSGPIGSLASVLGGGTCLPVVGINTCNGVDVYTITSNALSAAADTRGYTYLGGLSDPSGNSVIVVYSPGATAPIAFSALDGPASNTQLDFYPVAMAIDNGILYVLNTNTGIGLSYCVAGATSNACGDGFNHEYVTAYDTSKLTSGQSVNLAPLFVLGGDTIGHFGSAPTNMAAGTGQRLAVHNQTLYIANPTGPFCDPACETNVASGFAPAPAEVDIYNVAGLRGVHTDIAPAMFLKATGRVPDGVAIGPGGTVTGPPIRALQGVPGRYHYRWRGHRPVRTRP